MVIHFCIFFPIDSNNSYQGIHKFNEYRHLLDPLLIDNMWLLLKHAKKKKKKIHPLLFITNFHVQIIVTFKPRTGPTSMTWGFQCPWHTSLLIL